MHGDPPVSSSNARFHSLRCNQRAVRIAAFNVHDLCSFPQRVVGHGDLVRFHQGEAESVLVADVIGIARIVAGVTWPLDAIDFPQ